MRQLWHTPTKRELGAIPAQRKLFLSSMVCNIFLFLYLLLDLQSILAKAIGIILCILSCISIVIYVITVLNDGFITDGKYAIRDSLYLSIRLFRVVLALSIGIIIAIIAYQ